TNVRYLPCECPLPTGRASTTYQTKVGYLPDEQFMRDTGTETAPTKWSEPTTAASKAIFSAQYYCCCL
ncbi:hypothetical protein, partial [Bacteroides sp. OF03-11BH]|uniref:hypothetical protein n=1 Tax=Bacteroides sp. OF03-11BH TaxID=2292957 RepID=UPI001A9EEC1D